MKNKKFFCFCLLFAVCLFCTGCATGNFLKKYGTNITEYQLNLTLEQNDKLSGEQTTKYKNTTRNILSDVCFHLYANSFADTAINKPVGKLYEDKAYPNGFSSGKIDIKSVKVNGDLCNFSLENVDKDILKVCLNAPLYPNDFVKIEMEYEIKIPNVIHRFGWNDKTINLGNFYPIVCVFEDDGWDMDPYNSNGDPFYSNLANYHVEMTYPKDFCLASTGTQKNSATNGENATTKIDATAVRDFAMVLSKNFKICTATVDDVTINYYYYGDTQSDASLLTAQKALKTFNSTFGKYPYSTLSVVETSFLYGGMEYPNLVMISDNLSTYDDYTNTIVHEIAHQWWYGVVGNDEFANAWMDESLAEYSVLIFYEKNEEYQVKREVCIANAITSYTMFVDVYKDIFNQVDTSMNRKLNQYNTEPEYVYATYVRGMIMFDDIRNLIKDKAFFESLKAYYKEYSGKNATPENMIHVFENTSHKKLQAIFDSYLDGSAIIGKVESD